MTQLDPTFVGQVLVCAGFTITGLLLGHYLPWMLIKGGSPNSSIERYVWGSIWVMAPVSLGGISSGWDGAQVVAAFWFALFVGGGVVVAAYMTDEYLRERTAQREDAEITKARRGGR